VEPSDQGIKTPSLVRYFLLTYAITWILWASAGALLRGGTVAIFARPLFLLGTFTPGLVALAFTKRWQGRAATGQLLKQAVRWEVSVRWYVFAIAYIPTIKLTAALLQRMLTGAWPRFGDEPILLMAAAILVSTWVQAGEEIGWRGYALPRMSKRFGLALASLILGVIWATWHLPLFLIPAADTYGQSFPLYLLQVTAMSVALAWLYWRTGRSLLLVMLLHAATNNLKDIVPSAVPGANNPFALSTSLVAWLTLALLWLFAGFFLVDMSRTGER
jgi:membrane protease YdiL (CAAX protease family)